MSSIKASFLASPSELGARGEIYSSSFFLRFQTRQHGPLSSVDRDFSGAFSQNWRPGRSTSLGEPFPRYDEANSQGKN